MIADLMRVPESAPAIPLLIAKAGEQGAWRFLEFFTVNIRNPNTRVTPSANPQLIVT